MTSILLFIALSCPKLDLQGFTPPFTEGDKKAIESAIKTCPERFKKSPCPVRIVKHSPQLHYAVTCGEKR
jgi:hypothetical protein